MRAAALGAGVTAPRIHEESYTFDLVETIGEPAEAPGVVSADLSTGSETFAIEFTGRQTTVPCPPGSTVLEAAMSAGLDVPSSCTQGLCGTCKSTLTSGEVDMQHAGGIRPREIAAGKILLCCSRPLTDLVIAS
jgi:ferredoxin